MSLPTYLEVPNIAIAGADALAADVNENLDYITAAQNATNVQVNTNTEHLSSLDTSKIDVSVLDTDPALTSNSDTKIPTQKAVKAHVANASFNSALPDQTGNAGKFVTTDGTDASWGTIPAPIPPSIIRSARTSNTMLDVNDSMKFIDITSGTFTQTFDAASTLGSGWYCYIRNSGTGDITLNPDGSELIDGLTSYIMYPNEVRLIQCDGVGFNSVVLQKFYRVFTASGTFTKPPGYSVFCVDVVSAGGGGQGGYATYLYSSSGGGGGGRAIRMFANSSVGVLTNCIVGAGGSGGLAGGHDGVAGGSSSFGSLVVVYGGAGAGCVLNTYSTYAGGGGGGTGTPPTNGGPSNTYGIGAGLQNSSSNPSFEQGAGPLPAVTFMGGGCGALTIQSGGKCAPGGDSLLGAGGGGGGSYASQTATEGKGGASGIASVFGGNGVAMVASAAGANGADAISLAVCGGGGSGGNANASNIGQKGGNGGYPGGGGGGGGQTPVAGGAGGNGASGRIVVYGG